MGWEEDGNEDGMLVLALGGGDDHLTRGKRERCKGKGY
jgi:hypothetical protein